MDVCVLLRDDRSIDGEQYEGDQQYYDDQEQQQDHFEQGKYSMGLSLLSYSQLYLHSFMHVSTLIDN